MSIGVEKEQYYADHFDVEINKCEMLEIHIATLHRICELYINKNSNHVNSTIIHFLINYWQKHGNDSLIIFKLFDFSMKDLILIRSILIEKHCEKDFNFDFIKKPLMLFLIELADDKNKNDKKI